MHTGLTKFKKRRFKTKTLTQTLGKSVYAVFEYLASSSNLSTTIRCANSSSLSQSSSRNYLLYNTCKLSDLYKAGTSLVIDTLTVTPIKNNDNLLNTINSHIKLRKLKEYNSILTNYLNSSYYPRRESNNFLFY
ncbi:hypothetical protein HBI85_209960 [Parastagonospora nodorum]|nr:hypothetical protein HBI85_209960 [Parastagonospora nodorum]